MCPDPSLCWHLMWLGFCRSCSKDTASLYPLSLALTFFIPTSFTMILGGEEMCPIYGWTFGCLILSHLSSVFYLFVGLRQFNFIKPRLVYSCHWISRIRFLVVVFLFYFIFSFWTVTTCIESFHHPPLVVACLIITRVHVTCDLPLDW